MNRFFGMMPAEEVDVYFEYKDSSGLDITIEAGTKGWTVVYADKSTDYCDVDDTAENNFKKAYHAAVQNVGKLYTHSQYYRMKQFKKNLKNGLKEVLETDE